MNPSLRLAASPSLRLRDGQRVAHRRDLEDELRDSNDSLEKRRFTTPTRIPISGCHCWHREYRRKEKR
jgi:hypothetical protein